jgi:nucleotide-binding universal stress UspA family protein
MHILICSDGSPIAEQSATLISRLNYQPEAKITLLGVSESDGDQVLLAASFERMKALLNGQDFIIQQKIHYGNPADQILKEVTGTTYDLVAIGASGHLRGFAGLKFGSTAKKLARVLTTPLLVARRVPLIVDKVLICTGAEIPSLETLSVGGKLVAGVRGQIVVLHVMSQVAMRLDSPAEDLVDTAESAIQRGTREGLHLSQALNLLKQAGITGEVRLLLRHGLVVNEVLAEIEQGGYNLLIIGGHYHHGRSHWTELLLEDLAGQLLQKAPCSVLII